MLSCNSLFDYDDDNDNDDDNDDNNDDDDDNNNNNNNNNNEDNGYDIAACGGSYTAEKGVIQTPGYPALVNTSTVCVWIVTVPPATKPNTTNIANFTLTINTTKPLDM
jgi:hypothetical protein